MEETDKRETWQDDEDKCTPACDLHYFNPLHDSKTCLACTNAVHRRIGRGQMEPIIAAQSARIEELESENARLEIMAGEGKDSLDKARARIEELAKALSQCRQQINSVIDACPHAPSRELYARLVRAESDARAALSPTPTNGKDAE